MTTWIRWVAHRKIQEHSRFLESVSNGCITPNTWKLVFPEMFCVNLLVSIHALTRDWVPVITTAPLLLWLIHQYRSSHGNYSTVDAVTANKAKLNWHLRCCVIKIAFYMVHFFVYFYLAISTCYKAIWSMANKNDMLMINCSIIQKLIKEIPTTRRLFTDIWLP